MRQRPPSWGQPQRQDHRQQMRAQDNSKLHGVNQRHHSAVAQKPITDVKRGQPQKIIAAIQRIVQGGDGKLARSHQRHQIMRRMIARRDGKE